jgi:hypothetical protein
LCLAVEHSVKISNFLMKQVNISLYFNNRYINLHNFSLRVLSNIKEKFAIIEIMKTSPVMGKPVAIAHQLF